MVIQRTTNDGNGSMTTTRSLKYIRIILFVLYKNKKILRLHVSGRWRFFLLFCFGVALKNQQFT